MIQKATVGGNVGRFQYTGQMWLPEVGLYYYKARMYAPSLGRFMQTDPIGYEDGMNWYAYVGNDPVNKTDPYGMNCHDAGFIYFGQSTAPASGDNGTTNMSGGGNKMAVKACFAEQFERARDVMGNNSPRNGAQFVPAPTSSDGCRLDGVANIGPLQVGQGPEVINLGKIQPNEQVVIDVSTVMGNVEEGIGFLAGFDFVIRPIVGYSNGSPIYAGAHDAKLWGKRSWELNGSIAYNPVAGGRVKRRFDSGMLPFGKNFPHALLIRPNEKTASNTKVRVCNMEKK